MSGGKHASRSKSFEDLEDNRKGLFGKKSKFEEDDTLNVHNDILSSNSDDYEDDYEDEDEYDDEYYDERQINYKKIVIAVVIVLVVIGIIFGIYKIVFSNKSDEDVDNSETSTTEEMPSSVSGYKVLGQIIIEKLDVEQYILNLAEDEALENGVVKLYGASINSYGNFCIAGHNYEGVFKDLENLEIGDKIIIRDTRNTEYEYKVTSVKTVDPDDLTSLVQDSSKVEITLVTCTTDSTSRVIVKAEKVSESSQTTNTTEDNG